MNTRTTGIWFVVRAERSPNLPGSVLVLDRLIAYCHTSSLMHHAAQQRSVMSHALLTIAVEIAAHVGANPHPRLTVLECLHVLRMSKEQLLQLLGQAALRMPPLEVFLLCNYKYDSFTIIARKC